MALTDDKRDEVMDLLARNRELVDLVVSVAGDNDSTRAACAELDENHERINEILR